MKNNGIRIALLCAMLALMSVCLSSCYIPQDEVSGNTQNMNGGSQQLPFQSLAPVATATPKPTATNAGYNQGNSNWGGAAGQTQSPTATINWNDNWNTTSTPTATINWNTGTTSNPFATATPRSTIATITRAPSTAAPTATSSSLKKGSSGTEVKKLQQRLKDLGYYSGSVDGDFGDGTYQALVAFQKANGLTADGVAGTKTMQKLNSSSAVPYSAKNNATAKPTAKATATKKPSATATKPKATATPKPTATPNPNNYRYLEPGISGKNVTKLQERLISLGWLDGKADGEYDGATEAAVRAFQKKAGLYVDGKAGPDTQAALYASNAPKSSTPAASQGETLREGMNGDAVRALQKRLKELGYYTGNIDGDYGSGTTSAVKAFQINNGLSADGVAGNTTLNHLYSSSAVKSNGSAANNTNTNTNGATNGATATDSTTLRQGDTGTAVKNLQTRLKELGYYNGKIDGSYGETTASAVATFQTRNDLRSDGVAGPVTQNLLFGSDSNTVYNTLREGDESDAVKKLQYALYELGYFDGKPSGLYTSATTDAVRAFQIANSLTPVDGVAGNKTLQKIYSASALSATAYNPDYTTIRPGDKGNSVVEMQDVLIQLGYMTKATGVYDSTTEAAVRKFQKRNNLKEDGVAGSETLACLYGNNPKRAN